MKFLQSIVLGDNKLNCFKATQVLVGPTQILIWGSEIAKAPTRYIKGEPKFRGGGPMNPNDAMDTQKSLSSWSLWSIAINPQSNIWLFLTPM